MAYQPAPTVDVFPGAAAGQGYPDLNTRVCKALGITQLVIGIVEIILEIPKLALLPNYGTYLQGFWAGIFLLIAGSLGIASAPSKKNLVISCGVLSILAVVLSIAGLIVSFLVCLLALLTNKLGWAVIEIIMGLLFVAEVAVGIVQTVVCFRPACCPRQVPAGPPSAIYKPVVNSAAPPTAFNIS